MRKDALNLLDQDLWDTLVAAENSVYLARERLLEEARDLHGLIETALSGVEHREVALDLLTYLREEDIRAHLPELVDQASVGHRDIEKVRETILRMDRVWLVENIDFEVQRVIQKVDSSEYQEEEEYRRFAELYEQLDHDLLYKHLARCKVHPNEYVREIAADYEKTCDTLCTKQES